MIRYFPTLKGYTELATVHGLKGLDATMEDTRVLVGLDWGDTREEIAVEHEDMPDAFSSPVYEMHPDAIVRARAIKIALSRSERFKQVSP